MQHIHKIYASSRTSFLHECIFVTGEIEGKWQISAPTQLQILKSIRLTQPC